MQRTVPRQKSVCSVSPGEAGFSWSGAGGTTSTAELAAVAETVVEGRPPLVAKLSANTAATAVNSTVGESVGKVRPPEEAKYRATTESELAESTGEFPDVAKFVGKVRPLGEAKYRTVA